MAEEDIINIAKVVEMYAASWNPPSYSNASWIVVSVEQKLPVVKSQKSILYDHRLAIGGRKMWQKVPAKGLLAAQDSASAKTHRNATNLYVNWWERCQCMP